MIAQFNPDRKIRRGGQILTNKINQRSFAYYGLNVYKNFLCSNTFYAEENGRNNEDNELSVYVTDILLHIIDSVSCAAVFCVKLDGQKLIYQIDHDFHFEEDAFMEDEPVINFTRIGNDNKGSSFGIWDANNSYDAYGLIVETEKNKWIVIDE